MADFGFINTILAALPVLKKPKNPGLAAIIGFIAGAIGVGLYTWSLLDFAICFLVAVIAGIAIGGSGAGWLLGAAFAGVYGALRVIDSNKRIAAVAAAEVQPQPTSE